jgi:hypothetical protein
MTTHNPVIISNAQLTLDDITFGDAIDQVQLVPSYTTTKWKPVSGNAQTKVGALEWVLNLNVGQDFAAGGLYHKLLTEHGTDVTFKVEPLGTGVGQPSISGTVTLSAANALGGKTDEVATAGTALGVKGQPVITWGAATP